MVIAKLNEVKLIVTAYGYTRTSGWTQPTLKLSNSPSDPGLKFDFLAAPSGPASDALTPIAAGWIGRFEGNSAIQVSAETNSVEEKITDATARYKAAA